MARRWTRRMLMAGLGGLAACGGDRTPARTPEAGAPASPASALAEKVAQYTPVRLTADVSKLSDRERRMLPLLIDAAAAIDTMYRQQYYPQLDSLLSATHDSSTRRYIEINYGPWDRLDDDRPFLEGVGPRPPGAALYPPDVTKDEFERTPGLLGQYTVVRRDSAGRLVAVPYHKAFEEPMRHAAAHLREAAALADDAGLRRYLELRAGALETDGYRPSDMAWLDMKTNTVDVVIGPIESYIDRLTGQKTAAESYVLIKDKAWSARLARYAALLPALQHGLPVPEAYKRERPGTDSDLNAYDAVYYAGDANAGAKTIAINLPNDEVVQLKKGTRRLQLKNVDAGQVRPDPRADRGRADRGGPAEPRQVRRVLRERDVPRGGPRPGPHPHDRREAYRAGRAQGAAQRTRGRQGGHSRPLHGHAAAGHRASSTGTTLEDHYVTFLASIFRSVRFGAATPMAGPTPRNSRTSRTTARSCATANRSVSGEFPEDAVGGRLSRRG